MWTYHHRLPSLQCIWSIRVIHSSTPSSISRLRSPRCRKAFMTCTSHLRHPVRTTFATLTGFNSIINTTMDWPLNSFRELFFFFWELYFGKKYLNHDSVGYWTKVRSMPWIMVHNLAWCRVVYVAKLHMLTIVPSPLTLNSLLIDVILLEAPFPMKYFYRTLYNLSSAACAHSQTWFTWKHQSQQRDSPIMIDCKQHWWESWFVSNGNEVSDILQNYSQYN